MGVPKFYRWISERYPQINTLVTDSALLPEFDHLYLDMNGIIHGCTHPNHLDISHVISEKDMMLGIMHYLDRIITQIVKPKVSVFMAIDGVAPRAKLNQQRSRRFRSAMDMAEAAKEAQKKKRGGSAMDNLKNNDMESGNLADTGIFDSNCITPGTEFMEKVSNCIQYFIRKKIKEDPHWRHLKVIYSGHDIEGEGEHKIMQHIRDMRSQEGYAPNQRHCMYGQDADLIMLGLVSHEPHFTLLREIVDFGGGFNRNQNALKAVTKFTKQSDFQLLHLSILREYLAVEFAYGLDPSTYDLERLVDDFTFLTFLVGNDFLPHMPTLDIGDGAFDLLFTTYKEQRATWGSGEYLTESGNISDPARLEAFLVIIGNAETEIFEMREVNEVEYLKKRRKWDKRDGKAEGPSDAELAAIEKSKQNDYEFMISDMVGKHGAGAKFVDGWELPTAGGDDEGKIDPSKDHKGRYYFEKLKLTPVDINDHLEFRKSYIEGLIWCLAYYYRGCISWGWYFPYHYGPLISDLTNLPEVFDSIFFEEGTPLKPFQQLMGCLPPASSTIVPKPYRKLMCSPESPIIQFYPKDFEVDMNGKKNPWEGVNILPFIDGDLLKSTIAEHIPDSSLTADERRRNSRGKVFVYNYDDAVLDTVPSFNRDIGLPDIAKCYSRVQTIEGLSTTSISFEPKLVPGTKIPMPGFPSLNVLPIQSAELIPIGLNCFGSPSKYPNTVLTLHTLPELPGAEQLADTILGKHLYINWPMMHEAKVVGISDYQCIVRMVKKKKKVVVFNDLQSTQWEDESETTKLQYKSGNGLPGSGGVEIGDIQIRLKLLPLQGMKTSASNGSKKKVFGTIEADVPLQMVLWQSPAPDPRFQERGPMTLKDRFPSKSSVILTKGKYRGCTGAVVSILNDDKVGIAVQVTPPEPPFGLAVARSVQESYLSTSDASKVLKIHPGIFGKIVGSLFFNPGRYDLGLNLKYNREFCVVGYSRVKNAKGPTEGNKQASSKSKSAWGAGDSVRVVGNHVPSEATNGRSNNKHTNNNRNGTREIWEYTPKAIRLVAAFRQEFPKLFAVISRKPNERSYDAKLLGPDGNSELKRIREWLNNVETAKIPRTPCSTEAMPMNAVAAVQRAADVRSAALEQKGDLKEINVKIPPSALYREGSTAATDVLNVSDSDSPELGDRIVNLCANGLPFGARGTVVGIHDEKTGCVEVVMDKEFIGGSTLQGACANFRGKLCVWNHLLKVSASNSMDVVEQMIPAGSGKAAIEKILGVTKPNGEDASIPREKTPVKLKREKTPLRVNDPIKTQKPNAWGGSASKIVKLKDSKQAGWREAKGPPDHGIGFKGAGRKVKNGLQSWQNMIKSGGKKIKTNKAVVENDNATAAAGLKALLGVSSSENKPRPATTDATAGLKNMLGITSNVANGQGTVAPMPPPTASNPAPGNAADALMQMMVGGPSGPVYPMHPPQPPAANAGFNFTYVKEGEVQPPVPPTIPVPHQVLPNHLYHINMPMPPMAVMPMAPMMQVPAAIPQGSAPVPPNHEQTEDGYAT